MLAAITHLLAFSLACKLFGAGQLLFVQTTTTLLFGPYWAL